MSEAPRTVAGLCSYLGVDDYWAGSEASWFSFNETCKHVLQIPAEEFIARAGSFDDDDEEEDDFETYSYMIEDQSPVAILKVEGELVNRNRWFNRYFGVVSYQEIRSAAAAIVNHGGFSDIALFVDSPGGTVTGMPEASNLLDMINAQIMPITTVTAGRMQSGGYWLGAAGRQLYGGPMAQIGSIGVIATMMTVHRMLQEDGIDVEVRRSAPFKALHTPYEPISKKAITETDKAIGYIHQQFGARIADRRSIDLASINETVANGKTFFGPEAVTMGLLDGMKTIERVVGELQDASEARNQPTNVQPVAA